VRIVQTRPIAPTNGRKIVVENQHQKIKGYRDLSETEIADMNAAKMLAEQVGDLCKKFEMERPNVDKRWLAIARTDLQKGFMALVRSIARPETF
jgi:hypothetical protein